MATYTLNLRFMSVISCGEFLQMQERFCLFGKARFESMFFCNASLERGPSYLVENFHKTAWVFDALCILLGTGIGNHELISE